MTYRSQNIVESPEIKPHKREQLTGYMEPVAYNRAKKVFSMNDIGHTDNHLQKNCTLKLYIKTISKWIVDLDVRP